MRIGEKKKGFWQTKNEVSHPQDLKKLRKYDFCIIIYDMSRLIILVCLKTESY